MNAVLLYDITKKCNLQCIHCYNGEYYAQKSGDIDVAPVLKFIEENGIEHVHILGGEPFCADYLFEFAQSLKNQTVSINTNGTLLDKRRIGQVLQNENITQLTISLDGHDAATNDRIRGAGVFQRVCGNIKDLNEARAQTALTLNLAFVATPDNLYSLNYLADLCEDLSVDCLMVSFLYNEGNAKALRKRYDFQVVVECIVSLFEKIRKVRTQLLIDIKPNLAMLIELMSKEVYNIPKKTSPCYANNGYFYIDADQRLFPCSPCSKSDSDLYQLCDLKTEDYVANETDRLEITDGIPGICSRCLAKHLCNPCPIHCSTCASDFCEEANACIQGEMDAVITKNILESKEYRLIVRNGKLMLINFAKHETVALCDWNQADNAKIDDRAIAAIVSHLPDDRKDDFLFRIANTARKEWLYVS